MRRIDRRHPRITGPPAGDRLLILFRLPLLLLAGGIGNAPLSIRSDNIVVQGVRLRYINCPFAPFLGTTDQNVCQGK